MTNWQDIVTPETPLAASFPDCAVCDLSHLGVLRISGADMRTFLQGQLTNDIDQVTAELAQLSSYCSAKGRMLGSFWILQRGDDLLLQLPKAVLPAIHKRLQMFVLRAAVTIVDASDELARLGLCGDCASDLLPIVPGGARETRSDGDVTVLRLPDETPRFEVIGPAPALEPIWRAATAAAQQVGAEYWSLMDIRAGIPNVFEQTVEAFVPQMANLQLVDGVSFSKGCYTGQEVVARMQYLGKLKRRMYRAHIASEQRPAPGTELFSPSSESGQGAGRIVDAAASPDGGYEALAVLQISSAEAADLHVGGPDGPALTLLELPYAFADGES